MTIHTLRVTGMHCASCGLLIDDTLTDLPGVQDTHTRVRAGTTTVTINPDTIALPDVAGAITALGYGVDTQGSA